MDKLFTALADVLTGFDVLRDGRLLRKEKRA
jgi:hypothetical protein